MGKTLEESTRRVFSGALTLLFGFVLGGLLNLAIQMVIARSFSPDLYGIFSQSLALIHALVMLSVLGMNAGVSRFISYHESEDVKKAVASSIAIVLPVSVVVFSTLFLFAKPVSTIVFQDARTAEILRVISVAGPAMVVNSIIISGFRGFQKSKERVILLDFMIPLLQLLGVSLMIVLNYGIFGATAGYTSGFLFTALVAVSWYRKGHEMVFDLDIARKIARFSWPIMISSLAVQMFIWGPPVVVGYFASSADVGFLNSALTIGASTKMFLSSISFLFMPVISEHYSRGEKNKIMNLHGFSTKWIFSSSLPVLAFILLSSESVVSLLFGTNYSGASFALAVISAGYLTMMITGPMGDLLIAVGKIKREMVANIAKLAIFLTLSALMVPERGFLGGAIAYAAAMASGDLMRLWFGRKFVRRSYPTRLLKPVLAVSIASVALVAVENLIPHVIIEAAVFGLIYGVLLLGLKPLSANERTILDSLLDDHGIENEKLLDRLTSG